MKTNENGYCPHCKADLDGGDIVQTFIEQGNSPEKAKEMAANYGYGPGRTQWGRQIGQYSRELDRDIGQTCPDCKGAWR